MITKKYLFYVILIAFVIRLIFFFVVLYINPAFIYQPDSKSYILPALDIIKYGTFGTGEPPHIKIETIRTPGYPIFLAMIYSFSKDNRFVIFIQIFLSSLFLPLIAFYIGREMELKEKAIKLFLWLITFDPLLFIYNFTILTEELYAIIILFLVLLLLKIVNKKNCGFMFILFTGLVLGIQAYIRPVGMYLPYFVFMYFIIIFFSKKEFRFILKFILSLFLISIIVINLWIYRNYKLTGMGEFSSITGVNLLFYRATYVLHFKTGENVDKLREKLEKELEKNVSDQNNIKKFAIAKKIAVKIIISSPKEFLKATLNGMIHLLIGPGTSVYAILFKVHKEGSGVLSKLNDLGVLRFIVFLLNRYKYLFLFNLIGGIYLLFIYVLGFFGFLSHLKDRRIWLILMFIFYYTLVSAGGESYSRLRVPFEALLIFLAVLYFNRDNKKKEL